MTHINATVSHNGNPPFVRIAVLSHTQRDGVHIFKSAQIPGLLIMNKSLEIAVAQLPIVISDLIHFNEGLDCDVTLGIDTTPSDKIEEPDYAVIELKKVA